MTEKDAGSTTVVEAEPLRDFAVDRAELEEIHGKLAKALSDLDDLRDKLRARPENERISDLLAENIPPTPSFALSEVCLKVTESVQVAVDDLAYGLGATPKSLRVAWLRRRIEQYSDGEALDAMADVVAEFSGVDLYELLSATRAR